MFSKNFSPTTIGVLAICVLIVSTGCSDEVTAGDCPDDEEWNPIAQECAPPDEAPSPGEDEDPDDDDDDGEDHDDNNGEDNPCATGQSTSISGTVTIPSGELPLPEVAVYVPEAGSMEPIETGASCMRCEDELSGTPLAHTTTNSQGDFHLTGVPNADEVPLVIEIGKWRRQITVSDVDPCRENPLDESKTRLPSHSGEGELPQFAVTTGSYDALECLLRKIGISASEFTTDDGDGRVHLFAGEPGPQSGNPDGPNTVYPTNSFDNSLNDGADFTPAVDWWDDLDNLRDYDIIIHSCDGDIDGNIDAKSQQARQALHQFTEIGGRVFLSHWHNIWLDEGPSDFQDIADWGAGYALGSETQTGQIVDEFPKGEMLKEWMYDTGTEPAGEFTINEARGTVDWLNEDIAQEWIWIDDTGLLGRGRFSQYFSFNTPVHAEEEDQCGRVVFSDIHVAAEDESSEDTPFPTGCTTAQLTDQEKALVFMLFDLSQCIIDDGKKKGGPL